MNQDALSALHDGECSDAELDRLLDELERDPAVAQRWSRLCLAREADAGTRIHQDQRCICEGVMAALDQAPAEADAKVIDLAVRRPVKAPAPAPAPSVFRRYWKPVAGFAAAASMGALAVLLVQPQAQQQTPGFDANRSLPVYSNRPELTAALDPAETDHYERLRELTMDHSNSVSDQGLGGTLRYARFAAHTAVYRPQADDQP